jgi:HK97 family phage major capsid protein
VRAVLRASYTNGKHIMNLKEQRAAALKAAQDIISKAKTESRDLTTHEESTVEARFAEIEKLDEKIAGAAKSTDLINRLAGVRPDGGSGGGCEDYRLALSTRGAKGLAGRLVNSNPAGSLDWGVPWEGIGRKALVAPGATTTATPLSPGVVAEGTLPTSILDVLSAQLRTTPTWRYLRQVARVNNAAIVAAGAQKPESVFTVEPVENSLRVFAHLSEPVDRYLLSDNANLQRFVSVELANGIGRALEREVLAGDGTTGHLTGILSTTGVQQVDYDTDKITTLRTAITTLESSGFTCAVFVVNAADWAGIETSRNASGQFDLNGPIDRAARKSWGVQVVTTTELDPGTALALDTNALVIGSDGQLALQWSYSVGDDFTLNRIRARCEGRFALDVTQPQGCAVVDLTVPSS